MIKKVRRFYIQFNLKPYTSRQIQMQGYTKLAYDHAVWPLTFPTRQAAMNHLLTCGQWAKYTKLPNGKRIVSASVESVLVEVKNGNYYQEKGLKYRARSPV